LGLRLGLGLGVSHSESAGSIRFSSREGARMQIPI